ncbi:MAG: phosphotransferase [Pirellulales bacterium]
MSGRDDLRGRLQEDAERVVAAATAEGIVETCWIEQGVMTHKCVVTVCSGQKYIVRFYPPGREFVVDYEPDILERAAAAGVNVPRVVVDSRRGISAQLNYVCYERLPGVSLAERIHQLSPPVLARLGLQLVEQLRKIATIRLEGYGEPVTGLRACSNSWRGFLQSVVDVGTEAVAKLSLLSAADGDLLSRVVKRQLAEVVEIAPTLVWADVSYGNVLVNDAGELSGLIDFEGSLVGDSLLALGYLQAFSGRQGLFLEISKSWGLLPESKYWNVIDFYAIVRALRAAPFYTSKVLPNGAPRKSFVDVFPGLLDAVHRLSVAASSV